MTNRNKLIVGGVVVLGVLFLLGRNKKMKALAELKAQAKAKEEFIREQKGLAVTRPQNVRGVLDIKYGEEEEKI
jgi:hypothetical protein